MEELNHEQMQAVLAVDGPVIVFAGAGSGKTRTLTYRIAYMISKLNISPFNILAITFTNKATNEMRERLKSFVDLNAKLVTISTFHALCASILRREIAYLGYSNNFTILDEDDQYKELSEIAKELDIDKKAVKKYQKIINYNKCFMTEPVNKNDPDLNKLYIKYEERMKEYNLLDFEDLLLKVYELFYSNPSVLEKYQDKYKYILCDEFQDTNYVQYKILKLLSEKYHNIFVVGDDDQSIYSFRGTNYENINLFKKDNPDLKMFTLSKNYRSTKSIVNIANKLISFNEYREKKEMVTDIKGYSDDVTLIDFEDQYEEADYIASKIKECVFKGENYRDFAVLYRSSVLLRQIESSLIKMYIPYKVYGGISYLKRKEIKDVICYLKLIIDNDDVVSFRRIVNVPARGVGEATLNSVLSAKRINKLNIVDTIDNCSALVSGKRYEELKKFKNIIVSYSERLEYEGLVTLYESLLKDIGYIEYLRSLYDEKEADERIENINEFKSLLYEVDVNSTFENRTQNLYKAFDEAVLSESNPDEKEENRVTLSTIHSVKGLEYSNVFLIGLEDNLFPNSSRFSKEDDLEEERRICYVAMTRAKNKLLLTYCHKRLLYGNYFTNKPSLFLRESFDLDKKSEVIYQNNNNLEIKNNNIDIRKNNDNIDKELTNECCDYKMGDTVIHSKFGEGIIISIKNGIGNIFFNEGKEAKNILLSHPSLKKK